MDGAQTPYAMAVALQQQGASAERIAGALRARGLDDEGIALLLKALGARGEAAPAPASEWAEGPATEEPAGLDPGGAPTPVATSAEPCPRCGVFLSPATVERVLGVDYCSACAARPEVNYPRAYRDARWGKRDGWAWFFGVTGALSVLGGAFALLSSPVFAGLLVLNGAGGMLFWSGHPVGRPALIAGTALGAAGTMLLGSVPNVLGIVFVVMALLSARNRLFYRLEVSEAALAEAWRQEHDNQAARWAVATGAMVLVATLTWLSSRLSLWVTLGLSGLPIALGAIGLAKVDPRATPPIGRRGQAIAGLVLGVLVAVASALLLASGWRGL